MVSSPHRCPSQRAEEPRSGRGDLLRSYSAENIAANRSYISPATLAPFMICSVPLRLKGPYHLHRQSRRDCSWTGPRFDSDTGAAPQHVARNHAHRTPGDLSVPDPCEWMRCHGRRGAMQPLQPSMHWLRRASTVDQSRSSSVFQASSDVLKWHYVAHVKGSPWLLSAMDCRSQGMPR